MNSAFFLVLRRMRAPIIVLIAIYAIAVAGLTLVPGVDAEGQPAPPLSFFHAFYFISYTATTIGFGEIPAAFSDGQRLWVTVCIYLTVLGWSYSVVTLIALLQDKGFQSTLTVNRFRRRVRRLKEPFYLICGCGETGNLIARTFDRAGQAFVVVENNEMRVDELDLQDFKTDIPALAADARQPETLLRSGLCHPRIRGVLAVTNDEQVNLAIAIAVRLLNPDIPVVARARSPGVAANMASFGTDHIINPFERFADHLALAVAAPERFRLIELLTSLPESPLPEVHRPPAGRWIVCGYGRFGRAVGNRLREAGIALTIIDPASPDASPDIGGDGTEANTLLAAGIAEATGIIAGTDNDVNNLSIAMTARELNPRLFIVARQNHNANGGLFTAFAADFTMVPSHIVAQESVAILTTPLLARFLALLRSGDEARCGELALRLEDACGVRTPAVWSVRLNISDAPAAWRHLMRDGSFTLADVLRDGTDRSTRLPVVVLLVDRAGDLIVLPDDEFALAAGDELLLAGRHRARRNLDFTLDNANELDYVLDGREDSGTWFGRWLAARGSGGQRPA
ncbi:MAG: potassium channel protein [Betaproteobacteria bacterium]|nr:potassium channel protein [Betaproteobacteria bacterium]